jgi:putative endonuclease
MMTNKRRGTLYIGGTNNILRRSYEHKNELMGGFTKQYKLHKLVYIEEFKDIEEAIMREKQLKRWHRQWKINLIESVNPSWKDFSEEML